MEKLVRDRIPEIIQAEGRAVSVRVASDEEYWQALLDKLHEEHEEFKQNHDTDELVDILEVISAMAAHKGISIEQLEKKRLEKREERGGFEKRFMWTKP